MHFKMILRDYETFKNIERTRCIQTERNVYWTKSRRSIVSEIRTKLYRSVRTIIIFWINKPPFFNSTFFLSFYLFIYFYLLSKARNTKVIRIKINLCKFSLLAVNKLIYHKRKFSRSLLQEFHQAQAWPTLILMASHVDAPRKSSPLL